MVVSGRYQLQQNRIKFYSESETKICAEYEGWQLGTYSWEISGEFLRFDPVDCSANTAKRPPINTGGRNRLKLSDK